MISSKYKHKTKNMHADHCLFCFRQNGDRRIREREINEEEDAGAPLPNEASFELSRAWTPNPKAPYCS